ncbi:MAG: nitrogenase component 1, partial [Clostridia bacterium]|nr:nitrogenase component 1 [Clostridia bacterium]
MNGLWKYIAPFAPDQSGACAVLYELGGITIITDAGGCTGNICGFDEPRWFESKSAIFSAGLRDMDAILGRDEKLVEKLRDTVKTVDAGFAAIIGTPVPAVIASDYNALRLMAERSAGIPVIAVETNGMELYDTGAARTYVELIDRFTERETTVEPGRIGVLGAIPLDLPYKDSGGRLRNLLVDRGWKKVSIYGLGSGLEEIRTAGAAEKNLVVSPSGISAAKRLKKLFGTPYELSCPLVPERLTRMYGELDGKKVLVVHQAVMAETICDGIKEASPAAEITAA